MQMKGDLSFSFMVFIKFQTYGCGCSWLKVVILSASRYAIGFFTQLFAHNLINRGWGVILQEFLFCLAFFVCLFVCLFVCFYNSTVKVSGPHQIVLTSALTELTFKC